MSAGPCWRRIAMRWGAFLFLRAVVLSFPGKSGSSSPAQASGHPLTFAAEQCRQFSIALPLPRVSRTCFLQLRCCPPILPFPSHILRTILVSVPPRSHKRQLYVVSGSSNNLRPYVMSVHHVYIPIAFPRKREKPNVRWKLAALQLPNLSPLSPRIGDRPKAACGAPWGDCRHRGTL